MSCYVVGNKTLSVLARAITEKLGNDITCAEIGGIPPVMIDVLETVDNVGNALLRENVKAYNERYDEDGDEEIFTYDDTVPMDRNTIYGCIKCYRYQVSRAGFENTSVRKDLDTLERKLIEEVFADAPWGID